MKTARVRSFVSVAVSPLLVSCGWCGVGVIVCHAGCGWRRRVAVLAFTGSLIPRPGGGGLYEACGHRFRSAVRGRGVVEVLPISLLVVVSSHHFRRYRLSVCLLRCPRCHLPRAPCVSLSPISAPCASFSSSLSLCVRSFPAFSCHCLIAFLHVSSTSRAWRSFACLPLRRCSRPVVSCPRACLPHGGSLLSSSFPSSLLPSSLLVSRHRSHLVRVSPFFYKRWRGGWRLVRACLSSFSVAVSPVVRAACGGLLLACLGW